MTLRLLPCLAALAVLGCSAPPEAQTPISEAAAARPAPQLIDTDRLTGALAASGPTIASLGGQRDALAAEAETLRARAAALNGEIIDPATRDELGAAGQQGP